MATIITMTNLGPEVQQNNLTVAAGSGEVVRTGPGLGKVIQLKLIELITSIVTVIPTYDQNGEKTGTTVIPNIGVKGPDDP